MDPSQTAPPEREPVFQAPWPAVLVPLVLIAIYAAQSWFGADAVGQAWGFSSRAFEHGRWDTLVTALFLHGGWAHVLMNSAFILAFGTPVARRMGTDAIGALAFLAFFLVCGVLGNLVFAGLDPKDTAPLVGASGAGSGLMAATSRLLTPTRRLAGFLSPPVLAMAGAFVAANLIVAVVGWAPGAGDAEIAWQAHLGGYAAGLVLFAPALALLRRL